MNQIVPSCPLEVDTIEKVCRYSQSVSYVNYNIQISIILKTCYSKKSLIVILEVFFIDEIILLL